MNENPLSSGAVMPSAEAVTPPADGEAEGAELRALLRDNLPLIGASAAAAEAMPDAVASAVAGALADAEPARRVRRLSYTAGAQGELLAVTPTSNTDRIVERVVLAWSAGVVPAFGMAHLFAVIYVAPAGSTIADIIDTAPPPSWIYVDTLAVEPYVGTSIAPVALVFDPPAGYYVPEGYIVTAYIMPANQLPIVTAQWRDLGTVPA